MKKIILLLAILAPLSLFGQSQLRKGYIATQNGDTVSCLYQNGQWVLESDTTFVISVDTIRFSDGSTFSTASGLGSGDMSSSVYDPQNISADAFDRANMTGTQEVSTIIGLEDSLNNKIDSYVFEDVLDFGGNTEIDVSNFNDGSWEIPDQGSLSFGLYLYQDSGFPTGSSAATLLTFQEKVGLSSYGYVVLDDDDLVFALFGSTDEIYVDITGLDSTYLRVEIDWTSVSNVIVKINREVVMHTTDGHSASYFNDPTIGYGLGYLDNASIFDVNIFGNHKYNGWPNNNNTEGWVDLIGNSDGIISLDRDLTNIQTNAIDTNRVLWLDEFVTLRIPTSVNGSADSLLVNSTDTATLILDTLHAEQIHGKFKNVFANFGGFFGRIFQGDRANIDTLNSSVNIFGADTITSSTYAIDVLEFLKESTITVAKSGGTFTTIKEALDSITVAGSDSENRWVILVYPGVYTEDNTSIIEFPAFTALRSIGGIGSAIIKPSTSGDLFKMTDLTSFSGFQINDVVGGSSIVMIDTGSVLVSDMIFQDCDTSITLNSNYSLLDFSNSYFSSGDNFSYKGLNILCGNVVADRISVAGIDSIRIPFFVKGAGSSLTIYNSVSYSPFVDTFLVAKDTATVVMNSNSIINAKNGISSTTGSNVRFNGSTHTSISGSYTLNDATSQLGGYASNNDNDEALIIEGQELHVGDAAGGFETCFGEGDSYSDDMLIYSYNPTGSVYKNVSDSARNIDGLYFSFSNTIINSAIYIASSVGDSAIHHGLKLAMTDSMTIGAGDIIFEYWNGAWVEFNGMVTDGSAPFSYHAKDYSEQTQSNHIRYNIKMTNDDWITNDDPSYGSDKKWVRLRIVTGITSSPKIDQIKLHPSRLEINADGYPESFGNARNTQILQLNIGSGQPIEGNMQSQDIYVDENIGVGFLTNRFTTTTDMLGFPINFPDNLDTSSPISLVWSGRATNAASITWTIRWVIVTPDATLYTVEPAASGNAFSTTTTRTTVIGDNEIFTVELDVSSAIPSRQGGFGDQLWLTIQPTTLSGSFDLTNIGAEYWTWSEGGHY